MHDDLLLVGGGDSGSSVQAVTGAIFFILINQSFSGVFQVHFFKKILQT